MACCCVAGIRARLDVAGAERVRGGGADVHEDDGDELLVCPVLTHSQFPYQCYPIRRPLTSLPFLFLGQCLWACTNGSCENRSHGTYYFIAAGCQWSLGNYDEAQKLLDAIPGLIDKKKIGGKDLPTEVFIKKKCECSFLPFLKGLGD